MVMVHEGVACCMTLKMPWSDYYSIAADLGIIDTMDSSCSSEESKNEALSIAHVAKKVCLVTDFNKCLVCQKRTKSKVWNATPEAIEKFCKSAKLRHNETFKRLENELHSLKGNSVCWHPNCYKSYTNESAYSVVKVHLRRIKYCTRCWHIVLTMESMKVHRSSMTQNCFWKL